MKGIHAQQAHDHRIGTYSTFSIFRRKTEDVLAGRWVEVGDVRDNRRVRARRTRAEVR